MSTYLNRTFSGANTSRTTFTLSFWVKRTSFGSVKCPISAETNNNDYDQVIFTSSDQLDINNVASASDVISFKTTMKFRDPSTWYHIVIAIDTTQASSSNGIKIYVNGVLQTSFASSTYAQNATFEIGRNGSATSIGRRERDGDAYGIGYLAEFYYIDGQQKAATDFGETDSTTGIWKPKTYSGTYGNNGFRLEFKNAAALGTDTSGNSETFTVNNAGTGAQVVDTPSNVFATLNPLDTRAGGVNFSLGNLKVVTSGSNRNYVTQTQAFASGKWYMECRFTAGASSGYVGFCDMSDLQMTGTSTLGDLPNEARVNNDGSYEKNNSTTSGWAGSFTDNDILGLALDCDNNRFTLSKNGQWADGSGNYDEANPTAYITYTAGNFMSFAFGEGAGGATATIEINTGNAPYTISSGNADGAGYGNFEYAVPSGYYALCTENLNTYG